MGNGRRKKNNNIVSVSPTAAGDSASVVTSIRDEKPVHYTLKIQSFSLLTDGLASSQRERYESQIFDAGGYKWKLALYPNGDEKRNEFDHISLYLVTAEDNILSTTSELNVVFTFLVYDSHRDKYLTIQDGKMRRFSAIKTEWGFQKLVSLDTFNDASNGFLVDDCCVFGVDIFVMKCDGKGEVFFLDQATQRLQIYLENQQFFTTTLFSRVQSFLRSRTTVGIYGCILKDAPQAKSGFFVLVPDF